RLAGRAGHEAPLEDGVHRVARDALGGERLDEPRALAATVLDEEAQQRLDGPPGEQRRDQRLCGAEGSVGSSERAPALEGVRPANAPARDLRGLVGVVGEDDALLRAGEGALPRPALRLAEQRIALDDEGVDRPRLEGLAQPLCALPTNEGRRE